MKTPLALLTIATLAGAAQASEARWRNMDERYLAEVHQRIHPLWSSFLAQLQRIPTGSRYHDASLSVDILLTVERDGAITNVDVTHSAGLKGFDEAPVDLAHDVARLPAPPQALYSDDGKVYLRWRFKRSAPGCEEGAVVERRLPIDQAIPALIQMGYAEEAVARVEEAYREDPTQTHHLFMALTDQLGRVGMTDRDPRRRAAAAAILGHLDNAEVGLLTLLSEKSAAVRLAALAALADQPRSDAAVSAMLASLDIDSDRVAAIRALGRLGDHRAIAPLSALLAAGVAPADTAAALIALGARSDAAQVTINLLGGTPQARLAGAQAAKALVQLSLLPSLVAATAGGTAESRAAAVEAIGAIGERAMEARPVVFRALVDAAPSVRVQGAQAAVQIEPHSAAVRVRLVDMLSDQDASVRAASAAALARSFGNTEDVAWELWRMTRDRAPSVRAAIGEALALHPVRASAFVLTKLRHDSDPLVQQAINLAGIGDTGTVASPVEALFRAPDTIELLHAAAAWRAHEVSAPRAEADHGSGG